MQSVAKLWRAVISAWTTRNKLGDNKVADTEREFLPAALEIQSSPPPPMGRMLAWCLMSLFSIGVIWACVGKVDIVVTASGKVIPTGNVKVIQPLESGIVKKIHIKNGDRVVVGQPLIGLDATLTNADERRIKQQIEDLSVQLGWRGAYEKWLGSKPQEMPGLVFPYPVDPEREWQGLELLTQQCNEVKAHHETLIKERAAALAEEQTAQAELARVEAVLPILSERVAAYKYLNDKKYGAKVQYLEIRERQVELANTVPVLQSRRKQLHEEVSGIEAKMAALLQEQRKSNLFEMARLSNEMAVLQQDAAKAVQRTKQQVLRAPVAGTVQQLMVHTIGGVVTPAQELMKLVPESVVQVEAMIKNRDIGFVNTGQKAEVKIETFNFTKYGVIQAEVSNIAKDAITDEVQGWVFPMKLKLLEDSIEVKDKTIRLSPGMSVTAEIKTGKRRLIEYFLSPLLRYRQESIRER